VSSSNFQSALAVAQILGYMAQQRVAHAVIVTASRAFFIFIVPRASNKRPRSPDGPNLLDGYPQFPDPNGIALPDQRIETLLENSDPGIYVSSAVMVVDPAYLRIMAAFMVESYEFRSGGSYHRWMAEITTLLVTPGGLFLKGGPQECIPTPRTTPLSSNASTSRSSTPVPRNSRSLPTLGWDTLEPLLKYPTRVLTRTLGRERNGEVVFINWNNMDVAVKIVRIARDDKGQEDMRAFDSEVEAYKIAGRDGLWGVAVPEPLFVASKDEAMMSMRAIGTKVGRSLPHVKQWSPKQFSQARDAITRLYQADVRDADVHPRNVIAIEGLEGESVVAIDLEFSLDDGRLNLPPWIWGEKIERVVRESSGVS
jgi:hypothetical protein